MDQDTSVDTQSTETTTESSQQDASPVLDTQPQGSSEQTSTETQTSDAFTPDFKFKVMDEEKEFDEWIRPAITNAEMQAKAKELYEKAHGLDSVKSQRDQLKTQFEEMQKTYNPVVGDLKALGVHLKNQDYGSFFKAFNLTDEQILGYAVKRLEYLEADPAKKQQMDSEQSQRQEYAKVHLENDSLREYRKEQEQTQFEGEFTQAFAKPEISSVQQSFDSRAGKQGAFRDAVILHGATQSRLAGRHLPVQDVVSHFVQTFGLSQPASQPAATPQVTTGSSESRQRQESLPKIKSTGASPVGAKVKSLADLKNLQKKILDQGY